MKKLTVHVLENAPAIGAEYIASNYPHEGTFVLPNNCMYLVGAVGVVYLGCCVQPMLSQAIAQASRPYEMAPEPVLSATKDSGVSMNDLLKAIAVTRRPNLAKELCI
jgi:hypothetical protein